MYSSHSILNLALDVG